MVGNLPYKNPPTSTNFRALLRLLSSRFAAISPLSRCLIGLLTAACSAVSSSLPARPSSPHPLLGHHFHLHTSCSAATHVACSVALRHCLLGHPPLLLARPPLHFLPAVLDS
ncbi:hypothetical protein Dimus_027455 [Dionaea muscipula]